MLLVLLHVLLPVLCLRCVCAHPQVLQDPKWPEKFPFRPEDFLR
jgi:hypothetical protein